MIKAQVEQKIQDRMEALRAEKRKIVKTPIDYWGGDQIMEKLTEIEARIDEAQKIAALIGVEVV